MTAAELIAKVPALPAPAPSVTRLSQLLATPHPDTHEIIRVVSQDGVMSSKLLGRCNSAAYALRSPVSSIEHAVVVLGLEEIHKIILSVGFGSALSPALGGYAISEGDLWYHSLVTANIASAICNRVPQAGAEPAVGYTAGLIHDIGKTVITHALDAATQDSIRELIDNQACSFVEAEQQILGTNHAAVGECLLRSWGLPELLLEAVAHHHAPVLTPTPQLSAIVHVADIIAHNVGASPGWASLAIRADEKAVTALGFSQNDIDSLISSTLDEVQKIQSMAAGR